MPSPGEGDWPAFVTVNVVVLADSDRHGSAAAPDAVHPRWLSPDELVYVEERRQQEVPDDHERGQTQGNDYTSESVTWPDRRPNDHRRGQADRKPGCRKLHVTEHEVTLAHGISLRTAAAPDRYTDNARPPHPIDGITDGEGFATRPQTA
jgi:hypothetical protein